MKQNRPVTQQEDDYPANANTLSTTNLKGAITYVNDDFSRIRGYRKTMLLCHGLPLSVKNQLWMILPIVTVFHAFLFIESRDTAFVTLLISLLMASVGQVVTLPPLRTDANLASSVDLDDTDDGAQEGAQKQAATDQIVATGAVTKEEVRDIEMPDEAVQSIQALKQELSLMASAIAEVKESSHGISAILDIINEIAEQTDQQD
ncbi:hypothetical protein [Nitrincola sp. MINF-07-Sa-05]|uniref:hypothetical protein n=1 Tax=Nitrincola salilacus TaxID=3400273 RepID=UPI003917EF46